MPVGTLVDTPVDSPVDKPVDTPVDSPVDTLVDTPMDTPVITPLLPTSPEAGAGMKMWTQGIRSLLKSFTATVSEQALLASTSPDDAAEYCGLIYMQICLYYHKMTVCSLCLRLYKQAHKVMD